MSKKASIAFAGIVLAGTFGLATVASAAEGDGTGRSRPQLTTEERCAKSDEIVDKATTMQAKIRERIVALETKRAEAATDGNEQKVARIDKRLARLEKVSSRIAERLTKIETWVGEHCDV